MAEGRGRTLKCALLAALIVVALGVAAAPASAVYVHNEVTGEYGKEGSAATGIGNGCQIAWQESGQRLYLFADNKVYALHKTAPGAAAPAGGKFPIKTSTTFCGGGGDIAVDNSATSSAGNIYVAVGQTEINGYNSNGDPLAAPWPLSIEAGGFGSLCGLSVTNTGNLLVSPESAENARVFRPNGSSGGTLPTGYTCRTAVNAANNDLFVTGNPFGRELWKYSGADEYATRVQFPNYTPREPGGVPIYPGLAVNAKLHRLYISDATPTITVRDTDTGALIETIVPGGNGNPYTDTVTDIALDEATDTLFAIVGYSTEGEIKEIKGADVPVVTTGAAKENTVVTGTVENDGAGEVTECYFEFGPTPEYGLGKEPCSPPTPYAGPTQSVTANLNSLTREQTFHYRLVAGNANGRNFGADQTITPHYVEALVTDPAENVDRTTAKLNAHYSGNGEDTKFYFEWGPTTAYGTTSATPPGPSIGSPTVTTPLTFEATGLQPETLYHYRVVAENLQGTSLGGDQTFTTLPAAAGVTTEGATHIEPQEAELHGSFTGDGLDVEYFFEWGATTKYGITTPAEKLAAPSGLTKVSATIDGLQRLHTYHYRLVIRNSIGETHDGDQSFTTVSAPEIVGLSTSGVTGATAVLHATINPQSVDTEYHFEYGPTGEYGTSIPIPNGVIAASNSNEPVEADLTGLDGGVYHFRVVATSIYGVTTSVDQTFNFYPPVCPNASVRQQSGSNTLPDCRAYELVSPEDAGITIVYPASVPFSPTATAPSRVVFGGAYGLIEGTGPAANNVGDTYVATRTANGWKTRYAGIPSTEANAAGKPPWKNASYEPDKWLMDTLSDPSLSTIVDWNNGYRRADGEELFGSTNSYKSSNAPYVWDSTTGDQVDRWPTNVATIPGGEYFKGKTAASADLTHFVFTSDIAFAIGGEPGDMYDNDTVQRSVKVISLDAKHEHISEPSPTAVSEDGSHILMTSGAGQLYLSVDDAITYELVPGKAVNYLGMTPDGRKIYFTSTEDLTEDKSDPDTSRDLYMWSEDSSTPNHLTLISKGNEPNAGNTDACSASWTEQCNIVPISFASYTSAQGGGGGSPYSDNFIAAENGDIYFLSPEQLHGANGVVGMENLYDFRNGKLQFVAALEPSGIACTIDQFSPICSENAVARMEITPDDGHMAFLTGSKIFGYENAGHSEMYLYTPETEELICVSCVPTGKPPVSDVTGSHNGLFMTNDGRTFFETEDPLVPQDTNAAKDVYEYVDGRPQLITSGTNVGNNTYGLATIMALPGLVGVSADGTDLYFATYDELVGQDRNGEAVKIYDARSGGGFQFNPPVPPCVAADECHGPGSVAPIATPSGTGSDLGPSGNLQPSHDKRDPRRGKPRHKRKSHQKAHHRKGHRNG